MIATRTWFFAFWPASTSDQTTRRAPSNAFATAASNTRTLARQMSPPMPSPSMYGMIGQSGTMSWPSVRRMVLPTSDTFVTNSDLPPGYAL